jgi:hypothetical protein
MTMMPEWYEGWHQDFPNRKSRCCPHVLLWEGYTKVSQGPCIQNLCHCSRLYRHCKHSHILLVFGKAVSIFFGQKNWLWAQIPKQLTVFVLLVPNDFILVRINAPLPLGELLLQIHFPSYNFSNPLVCSSDQAMGLL